MSQVDLPSPPDDASVTINLEAAISADPDSPAGIGAMLMGLATCAEHYAHHRVMAASPRNSESEKAEERMEMEHCLKIAKLWFDEALPRLRRLKSDVIKDRIPEAGPFLVDAGVLAEELFSTMQFDFATLPELYKIALESYNRPGTPLWDPLNNSLRQFSNTADIFQNRLDTLAATLRDRYANKLRQVATSRIETKNVDEASQTRAKEAQRKAAKGNSPSDEVAHGGEPSSQAQLNETTQGYSLPNDAQETGDGSADSEEERPLKRCEIVAWESYGWVWYARPELRARLQDQWKHIRDNNCPMYEGLKVPGYQSWQRYIREARRREDGQEVSPRAGRKHGPSIAEKSEI